MLGECHERRGDSCPFGGAEPYKLPSSAKQPGTAALPMRTSEVVRRSAANSGKRNARHRIERHDSSSWWRFFHHGPAGGNGSEPVLRLSGGRRVLVAAGDRARGTVLRLAGDAAAEIRERAFANGAGNPGAKAAGAGSGSDAESETRQNGDSRVPESCRLAFRNASGFSNRKEVRLHLSLVERRRGAGEFGARLGARTKPGEARSGRDDWQRQH